MRKRMTSLSIMASFIIVGSLIVTKQLISVPSEVSKTTVVRVGYLSNITHAQVLLGLNDSTFQKALGEQVKVEAIAFNAGPSIMEAMLGGAIDIAYIGPNPAINGYIRSQGAIKILAGACSGGARLIIRESSGIKTVTDFRGKKIATPQLGNTQDVAARNFFVSNGLQLKTSGGDVEILPIKNPDQLTLFRKGELDAAWAPEPWASRLVIDGKGKEFLDERTLWVEGKFPTTVFIGRTEFIQKNPEIIRKWIGAQRTITAWLRENKKKVEVSQLINKVIAKSTGQLMPQTVLDEAIKFVDFSDEPLKEALEKTAMAAYNLGFLGKTKPDISGLFELSLISGVYGEQAWNSLSPQDEK